MSVKSVFAAAILLCVPAFAAEEAAKGFAERDPEYRLQVADSIEVQYRLTPEYNAIVTVQPDGSVALPVTGTVKVAGLSAREAGFAIRDKAAERLRDPEVSVVLKDFVRPYFTIAGQVAKPGRYDLRGEVTVVEAIAMSGWFLEGAKHSQVLLVRRVDQELGEVRVLDLKRMSKASFFEEQEKLRSGDLLVVPQTTLSKIDRYFRWASLMNLGFLLR